GCMNSATIMFTINPAPMVVIDPAGPFCESDPPVQINAIPPGGSWGGQVSPGGLFRPSVVGAGTYIITYSFTNASGCTDEDEILIEVAPNPDLSLDSPDEYCESESLVFLFANPPGGIWGGQVGPNGDFDPSSLGPGVYI